MITKQIHADSLESLRKQLAETSPKNGFGLYFCSTSLIKELAESDIFASMEVPIIGCSTSGEISNEGVNDDSIIFNLVEFESDIKVQATQVKYEGPGSERSSGKMIGESLKSINPSLVFTLGVGVDVNGSEFVRGLQDILGGEVPITGGLAGDNAAFTETFVGLGSSINNNQMVAIGLSGKDLKLGYGSRGGWEPFGPERKVTKAEGNILKEIDGQPALEIYKSYLGDKANDLPGSGLLYPVAIREADSDHPTIRTILGMNEEEGSLIMAGEILSDTTLQLMHTGSDGLIAGSESAAKLTKKQNGSSQGFAVLVSCVGRKLVMGEDIEDEIDAVRDELGSNASLTGFYSNGEICPFHEGLPSQLHNQTMTITYISEN